MANAAPSTSPLARFPYHGIATPVVRVLVGAHLIVWALLHALGAIGWMPYEDAVALLGLSPQAVLEGLQPWRVLTYAFVHPAGPFTLALTQAVLFFVGREVESMLGSARFGVLYGGAVALVGAAFVVLGRGVEADAVACGSTGAVLAVLVAFVGYHARDRFVLLRIFALEAWLLGIAIVAVGIAACTLDAQGAPAGASALMLGHAFGGFVGLVWVRAHHRVEALLDRAARPRRRLDVPAVAPIDDLESETDRILEKIAREGMQSLTPHERGLLEKASQHFKRRKQDEV